MQASAPEASTPEWGGAEKTGEEGKEAAAAAKAGPKTWKGVGLYQARLLALSARRSMMHKVVKECAGGSQWSGRSPFMLK